MSDFFNRYSEFQKNGHNNDLNRLNNRYDAIIDWNREIIEEARVLDIGAHNGRWAFAALEAGAKWVECVEAHRPFCELLVKNMAHYNQKNYSLANSDIVKYLPFIKNEKIYDVILCCGVMYHTIHYVELLKKFSQIAKYVIFDTLISNNLDNNFTVFQEPKYDGVEYFNDGEYTLVGIPNKRFFGELLENFGFKEIEYYPWE